MSQDKIFPNPPFPQPEKVEPWKPTVIEPDTSSIMVSDGLENVDLDGLSEMEEKTRTLVVRYSYRDDISDLEDAAVGTLRALGTKQEDDVLFDVELSMLFDSAIEFISRKKKNMKVNDIQIHQGENVVSLVDLVGLSSIERVPVKVHVYDVQPGSDMCTLVVTV